MLGQLKKGRDELATHLLESRRLAIGEIIQRSLVVNAFAISMTVGLAVSNV